MSITISKVLIAGRWPMLVCAIVMLAAAVPYSGSLGFDRSIENMFADSDPLLVSYRKLKRTFGGNEIVLAVYVDEQLLDASGVGIARLASIAQRCEQVPGVRSVLSLERPIGDAIVSDGVLAARTRALFEQYTHGRDGATAAVVCMLDSEAEASVTRAETIQELRKIIVDLPDDLPPGVLAGEPVMVVEGFRYVEEDGRRLGILSTVLLAITICVCFQSLRWVLIPICVVQMALMVTRALLVWSNLQLSMVSSMLTAIVTVVGVATVVHVIVRYREGQALGRTSSESLQRAISLLAAPIFWACCTDAVGFASLTVASVGPIRDFGVMMALGSLVVLACVTLLLPGLVSLLEPLDRLVSKRHADQPTKFRSTWGEAWLERALSASVRYVRRSPGKITAATGLVTVLSLIGMSRLTIETDFTRNFRDGSPIVRSYQIVEQRMGGAGVLDIILPAPERLDWEYLRRVLRLEQRLSNEVQVVTSDGETAPALTKSLSLADAVNAASPAPLEQIRPEFARQAVISTTLAMMQQRMPVFSQALSGKDPDQQDRNYVRIMLRAYEQQPADQKLRLVESVRQICEQEFPTAENGEPVQVTGFFVLLANLIASILRDQWLTFGVATVGIGTMMMIAFRSPLLAAMALIPNALPILLVLGSMGWMEFSINMGAAMIAAVSMGLSVDSSIHYITFYRRARLAGKNVSSAIDEVQQSVGRAAVFSTLALIVGFSALCTSDFVPTIYFGFLVSLAMLGGLLGNLILLPLLLTLAGRFERTG